MTASLQNPEKRNAVRPHAGGLHPPENLQRSLGPAVESAGRNKTAPRHHVLVLVPHRRKHETGTTKRAASSVGFDQRAAELVVRVDGVPDSVTVDLFD